MNNWEGQNYNKIRRKKICIKRFYTDLYALKKLKAPKISGIPYNKNC